MRRRHFAMVCAALLAAPSIAQAQPKPRVFRLSGLSNSSLEAGTAYLKALEDGLADLGYVVGKNLAIQHYFSAGRPELLPRLAAEIVRGAPDVILTVSNAETAAAKAATTSIPIVMALGAAPVEAGLVASLARPGGNVTGITTDASPAILAKWLELLTAVKPGMKRVGMLWDPTVPGFTQFVGAIREAADRFGLELASVEVKRADEMERALQAVARARVDGLCVIANVLTFTYRDRISAFVVAQRLPAITYTREFVEAGMLMSYGADLLRLYRRSTLFVDRILKGAKPADLPVEQPTEFEMVVNLKSAKSLGLTIPPAVLLRANKVIE